MGRTFDTRFSRGYARIYAGGVGICWRRCYGGFPRALFAADHRLSISLTATFMLGRYFFAAASGVIDDEKKIRLMLPSRALTGWPSLPLIDAGSA